MPDAVVTAICPTFNRPTYLVHAVELFLAQTWTKSELIVIDDSDQAHQASLPQHPRIKHIRLKERLSLGEKHNQGNAFAQGDVIAYFDDDDWFHPRRFVKQLEPILTGAAKITGFPRDYILAAGPKAAFYKIKSWPLDPAKWIGNGATNLRIPIHDGSAFYSREAIDRGLRHPDRTMNEKVDFLNQMAGGGMPWMAIENTGLFVYVRHGENTWKYREDLVNMPVPKPTWFPDSEFQFYRRAVA